MILLAWMKESTSDCFSLQSKAQPHVKIISIKLNIKVFGLAYAHIIDDERKRCRMIISQFADELKKRSRKQTKETDSIFISKDLCEKRSTTISKNMGERNESTWS
jgi:hypothetical protein